MAKPADRLKSAGGRGGEVVDEALGESFGGILVSDFYVTTTTTPA